MRTAFWGVSVKTHEAWPVIIVALDDIAVLGSIEVLPGTLGGGLNLDPLTDGAGSGGGVRGNIDGVRVLAAEGASFCGTGGRGAAPLGSGLALPREVYGPAELSALLGGSAGGPGATAGAGSGGGAIELVAGGKLSLARGALITAPGGGGAAGAAGQPASGGGRSSA
jgi:hypothetical protein